MPTVAILSKISPVRTYSLINVYTYDFKTFGPVPLGLKRSFKNVRYNTINDKNKYKSKDHLFMFKTTIMVNKRKKNLLYNFDFRQTAILILYFFNFNPFLLLFSSFFPTFFVLILSYLSGTCIFVFADISGRNFLFSSGHF